MNSEATSASKSELKAKTKANSSLRILPDRAPLRNGGPFVEPLQWSSEKESKQPRALRSLAKIIDGGLCHRCGSCVGICPTKVLGRDKDDYPTINNLSACTDCDLCVKVCPGDEFDFHRMHERKFGTEGNLKDTHGHFERAVIAYATYPGLRDSSTSGGLVTAMLLHLLETKQIDGAVVIVSGEDKLWSGEPIIARTKEEILSAAKSKYAITPTNSIFSKILDIEGKYALVGLPCQIHGYEKAAELDPRLRDRVVLTIGLFCHAAIEHEAFEIIWDSMGKRTERATNFVSRIGKHPGAPHLTMQDGSSYPVYFGDKQGFRPSSMEMINILYRLYTPARCLTCFDGLSEFADVSVGDPWMPPPEDDVDFYKGWSFGLLRSKRAQTIFDELCDTKKIEWKAVTEKEAHTCNEKMSTEKRWRAFRVIESQRRQGKAIPAYGPYGLGLPAHSGKQFFETEGNMLSHVFCFLPKYRARILRFFLGNGGYCLLWLNNKRRRLKFFLRDNFVKYKRKIYGRK